MASVTSEELMSRLPMTDVQLTGMACRAAADTIENGPRQTPDGSAVVVVVAVAFVEFTNPVATIELRYLLPHHSVLLPVQDSSALPP